MLSRNQIAKLEQSIGYSFTNQSLLIESLSHPSLKQHSHKPAIRKDNELLELLGDSILGFVITEILFKNFTNLNEGDLAKIRSYLVCREMLCNVAAKINLVQYIIMTSGEEISGGRSNPNNIENAMEALIAAIYLDSNIEQTKAIIKNLWKEFVDKADLADFTNVDPKTSLQEWSQSRGRENKPIYEILKKEGSSHSPIFTVIVKVEGYQQTATGTTLKAAEKEAARKLLKVINNK